MDSLTHAAVGAAIGEGVGGRELGNKAPALGALIGMAPDIDYIVALFFSDAAQLSIHRTYTHSVLALMIVTVLAGWIVHRRGNKARISWQRGAALAGLAYGSHLVLDLMTSYGVQVLLPFTDTPFAFYNIAIIDPLVTLPVAVGVLYALFLTREHRRRRIAVGIGLGLSALYLSWSLFAQQQAQSAFEEALARNDVEVTRSFVKPTVFNTILWRGLAETEDGYVHGFYSLFDEEAFEQLDRTPKNHHFIDDVRDEKHVRHLLRNMQGYYRVKQDESGVRSIVDMRFGRASEWAETPSPYVFEFQLVEREDGSITVEQIQRSFREARDRPDFGAMWSRITGT